MGLFNIDNRWRNLEISRPYSLSNSVCTCVHTKEQPAK